MHDNAERKIDIDNEYIDAFPVYFGVNTCSVLTLLLFLVLEALSCEFGIGFL